MKLHNVTSNPDLFEGAQRGWCGPAAVSAITGRSRECATAWINFSRRRPPHHNVRGSYTYEVTTALAELGYVARREYVGPELTLARWLKLRSEGQKTHVFLVVAGSHFIVVKGNRAVCSLTGKKVATSKSKKRRAKVESVHWIRPIEDARGEAVRKKRIDPLPPWSRWKKILDSLHYGYGRETSLARYRTRPYPKTHEVPAR